MLLDLLLFNLVTTSEKETALLVIPEICTNRIITLYHSSLFVGCQGVIKTHLTIGDIFFIQGLKHHLRSYVKGCHLCQLSRNEKPLVRQLQQRINLNYRQFPRLSMGLKVMLKSYKSHGFILCLIDEVMNYLITIPICQSRSEEMSETFIEKCNIKVIVHQAIK